MSSANSATSSDAALLLLAAAASNPEFDDEEDVVGDTGIQNDAILLNAAEFPLIHSLFFYA